MELKENISTKPADARIVQAVRKLKSSKLVEQKMEVRKNQEDITQLNDTSNMHIIINSNNSNNNISQKKTVTPLQINQKQNNNQNMNKQEFIKSTSKNKILIDGGGGKPSTGSISNNKTNIKNSNNKQFDYETLRKYKKKQKTDYQKNLLSEKNIEKYKEDCLNLIKKDKELKNLFAKNGISKDEEYMGYINDKFFSQDYFLFELEILINETVEEANTLKVFRTNKNVLPLKVVKERFYKDSIKKDLERQIYQEEYEGKFTEFTKNLDDFINNLKNENL
jgi:hypothetical protein